MKQAKANCVGYLWLTDKQTNEKNINASRLNISYKILEYNNCQLLFINYTSHVGSLKLTKKNVYIAYSNTVIFKD